MTKAQEVYEKVEELVASGTSKADAFKQLAEQYGQPVDSLRGSYYSHKRVVDGAEPGSRNRRTRRRETTTADAVDSAIAVLERSKANIDTEVQAAEERAKEAKAEYDALKGSAAERKAEIDKKIAALKASS
jgi:chromosome segregation ATPase